ncbi:MAG: tRNA 2-thiouridine(34) synthase MnmA [Deltaproteobacteria bacterium]|nr:tRNA 2-thiouridine(34) synthase MnmA [Deltaproteobacteria bacterium]
MLSTFTPLFSFEDAELQAGVGVCSSKSWHSNRAKPAVSADMSEICILPASSPVPAEDAARAADFVVAKGDSDTRVVVALSGGVDSAVTAWLMKEAGYDVTGVSLRLAPEKEEGIEQKAGRCCSADDMTDARQLCESLHIPFYAIDARSPFFEAVMKPFAEDYQRGITPIPCLACNHVVKFGDLFQTAQDLDADLATGHYARIVTFQNRPAIARPADRNRDQTYYLYGTPTDVVGKLRFPLGDIDKPLARALAERAGIKVWSKPDSQEICFVPDGDHARVVESVVGELPKGDLVTLEGKKLRVHEGIHHFTIGQRRGIGIGTGKKLYVVDVDGDNNEVIVGPKDALFSENTRVQKVKLMHELDAWPDEVKVQVRARATPVIAKVKRVGDDELEIQFASPIEAVALGQAAVFYSENDVGDEVLLGGGTIMERVDGARPRRIDLNAVLGATK